MLLCSRLHWTWVATWWRRKKLSKPLLAFNLSPGWPRAASLDIIVFLADCLVTAELDTFQIKLSCGRGKTVLLITLVVNYCPHTYYLCQFLWGELIAFGQEWVYCGMLYNYTSSEPDCLSCSDTDTTQLIITENYNKFQDLCLTQTNIFIIGPLCVLLLIVKLGDQYLLVASLSNRQISPDNLIH